MQYIAMALQSGLRQYQIDRANVSANSRADSANTQPTKDGQVFTG